MSSTETFTPVGFARPVTDTDIDTDDGSSDFDGWYCVKTDPFPCPCGLFTAHHMTAFHLILVWPDKDDPNMLDCAHSAQGNNERNFNRNPEIIEYEKSFGPAISFYEFEAHGRKVHRQPGDGD